MRQLARAVGYNSQLQYWGLIAVVIAACSHERRNTEPVVESTASQDASTREQTGRDATAHDAAASSDAGSPPPVPRSADASAAPKPAPRSTPEPPPEETDAAASDDDAGRGANPGVAGPTLDALMQSYHAWTKRTAEPLSISNSIWGLCRLPSLAEQAFVDSEHGDGLYLLDWVNAEASQGLAAGGKPAFPVGAAIVKEKLKLKVDGTFMVVARGLMIKRGAGFDPTHGDWDFGYWEPASGLASGEEPAQHCGGCHASSKTDYVFVDISWRYPPLN